MEQPGIVTRGDPTQHWRRPRIRALYAGEAAVVAVPAAVAFLAHMLVSGNYGYFRDELYYIVSGQHLAFGYVDFPPLIALLAAALRPVSGDSLVVLHIVPALASALLILITGWMARELGGGRFAQILAALASLVALVFLGTGSIFSMDVLDELWWTAGAYVVIRLLKRDDPRLWLLFGLIAGIGVFTKLTMLAFGLAVTVGLLLTPERRYFRSPWIWLGGFVAFLFLLPYVLWNQSHGWATLQFWHNYGGVGTGGNPITFLANQAFLLNPFTAPIWLAGLWFYVRTEAGRPYRALGWAYLVLFALFALAQSKSYFLAPAYPMLFAAGGVLLARSLLRRPFLRAAYASVLVVSGLLLAPLAMPVLSPSSFIRYYGFLSGVGGATPQNDTQGRLPQYLADRFGWPGMVTTVAGVYDHLPAAERARACIFTLNYGEASALTFLGSAYHLPHVISGHNTYYIWGPGSCSGAILISVGESRADMSKTYRSVTRAATIRCTYCMPEENGVPVYVSRNPRASVSRAWVTVKHFN